MLSSNSTKLWMRSARSHQGRHRLCLSASICVCECLSQRERECVRLCLSVCVCSVVRCSVCVCVCVCERRTSIKRNLVLWSLHQLCFNDFSSAASIMPAHVLSQAGGIDWNAIIITITMTTVVLVQHLDRCGCQRIAPWKSEGEEERQREKEHNEITGF